MNKTGTVYIKSQTQVGRTSAKKETKKLEQLAEDSNDALFEVSSVFPFELFPDKIIIDSKRVTVVKKDLFSKSVFPILIEDIKTVNVFRGLIFASIEFEIRGYETNPLPVRFLWPYDATQAKQYILGLMTALRENIDVNKVPRNIIKDKVQQIGSEREEVQSLF